MGLLKIRTIKSRLFLIREGGWFAEPRQRFSRDDVVSPEWIILRKDVSSEQEKKQEGEYIPNVAEVLWIITTYKKIRDAWLINHSSIKTSSVDADGYPVFVGVTNGGITISNHRNIKYDNPGILYAWRN
jgi:hypothetical protein